MNLLVSVPSMMANHTDSKSPPLHVLLTTPLLLWGTWGDYRTLVPCQGDSVMGGHLRAAFLAVYTSLLCSLEATSLVSFLYL